MTLEIQITLTALQTCRDQWSHGSCPCCVQSREPKSEHKNNWKFKLNFDICDNENIFIQCIGYSDGLLTKCE
jgi:hypothetical protein